MTENIFWDSCIFTAFLKDEHNEYDVQSIKRYLDDAKGGRTRIYCSTIVIAEILPSKIKGSFNDFLNDFENAIVLIDPTPNIMTLSSRLRDLPYRKGSSIDRRLTVPDAITLATCVVIQEAYSVRISNFHTFDKGRKRDANGIKPVPLLGYEEWCSGFNPEQMQIANRVISIHRNAPNYGRLNI